MLKYKQKPSFLISIKPRYFYRDLHYLSKQKFIRVTLLVALLVWSCWLTALTPSTAITNVIHNWEIALTMVFGSIVAGGTSLGGGAVAFPVLTKVLDIPPHEAKVFALAIQTIGMGAASITIMMMQTKVEWRLVPGVSLGGIGGIAISSLYLSPILPANIIKISFSMMISSFALILLFLIRNNNQSKNSIGEVNFKQVICFLVIGFIGGLISGLVGSGLDIFVFSVMVLLFNISEKVSTTTSVVLMAFNSLVGFLFHLFLIGDFVTPVSNYWLAAVPVVVVGAPLGAMICSRLHGNTVIKILLFLISIDCLSSILLIPLSGEIVAIAIVVFLAFTFFYYLMYRCQQLLT